jgi:hypothetical protein
MEGAIIEGAKKTIAAINAVLTIFRIFIFAPHAGCCPAFQFSFGQVEGL